MSYICSGCKKDVESCKCISISIYHWDESGVESSSRDLHLCYDCSIKFSEHILKTYGYEDFKRSLDFNVKKFKYN